MAAVVTAFVALGLSIIARGAPLGHDEAVYALRSRFYALGDVKGGYWNDYRAVGLPWVLAPLWFITASEPYLRAVVLAFGALGVIATWYWARLGFGGVAGVIAASMLAFTPEYFKQSTMINVDVPAMTLSLGAILLFARASVNDSVKRVAIVVVPLVAGATAVRYGAPLLLFPGLAAVAVWRWRAIRRSWTLTGAIALASGASILLLLFVPSVTGSAQAPFGQFRLRQVAKEAPWWASASDFGRVLPSLLGIVGVLTIVGLVFCAALWRRRALRPQIVVNLVVFATFLVLLSASLGHGEARYLIPALPFAFALAAGGLAAFARVAPPVAGMALVAAVIAAAGSAHMAAGDSVEALRRFSTLRTAARELGATLGPECAVFTSYSPQVAWYSGCAARAYPRGHPDDVADFWLRLSRTLSEGFEGRSKDTPVTALLVQGGKRQPEGSAGKALESLLEEDVVAVGDPEAGRLQHVRVVRLGELGDLQERFPFVASD